MNGFAPQIIRKSVLQHPDCHHCLGRGNVSAWGVSLHGGTSHTGEVLPEEGSHSHSFLILSQIAPAEGPDASERMVIITGPPEAQFKVRWPRGGGWLRDMGRGKARASLWSPPCQGGFLAWDHGFGAAGHRHIIACGSEGPTRPPPGCCPPPLCPFCPLSRPRGEYLGS